MAKKKTSRRKRVAQQKAATTSGSKKLAKKKPAAKKKAANKNAAISAKPTKKTVKKTTRRARPSLGRPRVPGTTRLDRVLKHDYEAQQIFGFLNVHTVKELETHSPQEIIDVLTAPVVKTVDKIRKALAINNRCLAGDERFALQFQKSFQHRK